MGRKASHKFSDQDYWEKLSPEETRWLREFNANWYDGRKDASLSAEQQRAAYRRARAATGDITAAAKQVNAPKDADQEWFDVIGSRPLRSLSEAAPEGKRRPTSTKRRRCGPEDYRRQESTDLSDSLVAWLDSAS